MKCTFRCGRTIWRPDFVFGSDQLHGYPQCSNLSLDKLLSPLSAAGKSPAPILLCSKCEQSCSVKGDTRSEELVRGHGKRKKRTLHFVFSTVIPKNGLRNNFIQALLIGTAVSETCSSLRAIAYFLCTLESKFRLSINLLLTAA